MPTNTPELIERFRAGDAEAYEVLFLRYEVSLSRFVKRHLTGAIALELQAEDVVQDVHVAALRAIGDFQYRSELSFFLWLCAIARNRLRMHARRLGRRPPATSLSAFSSSSQALGVLAGSRSPAGVLSRHEEVQLLAAGMAQLSPRRRRALMLRYLDEMENDEAALAMGMSVGAFRVLLSRALVDLREELLIIAPEEPA